MPLHVEPDGSERIWLQRVSKLPVVYWEEYRKGDPETVAHLRKTAVEYGWEADPGCPGHPHIMGGDIIGRRQARRLLAKYSQSFDTAEKRVAGRELGVS